MPEHSTFTFKEGEFLVDCEPLETAEGRFVPQAVITLADIKSGFRRVITPQTEPCSLRRAAFMIAKIAAVEWIAAFEDDAD